MKNCFPENEIILGLKIDVDTYRGTKYGVPALSKLLLEKGLRGSFFFSVGPDNMGRHAWRLLKPKFFMKMFRGNAAKLYGFDIIFKGLLWPGPDIGKTLSATLRQAAADGHETALHALDHYKWQMKIMKAGKAVSDSEIRKANEVWASIFGDMPKASGNPGWQLSGAWLDSSDEIYKGSLLYRSDCRGSAYGYPVFEGKHYKTLQIPSTLPTFDELIGREGITPENYNDHIISLLRPGKLNVISIHAEVEGGAYLELFRDFLGKCRDRGIRIVPLRDIYEMVKEDNRTVNIRLDDYPGREGKLAIAGGKDK